MKQLEYRALVAQVGAAVDGRTISGVAVPYGKRVKIRESAWSFDEMFQRGAFDRSIEQRAHKVKILAQHDHTKPIGRAIRLEDRPDGLHIEAVISETRDGDDALQLIRDGVLDSFSVGFVRIQTRTESDGLEVVTEAALHEVSLVTFPAYPGAVITGLRAGRPNPPTLSAADALHRLAALERKDAHR